MRKLYENIYIFNLKNIFLTTLSKHILKIGFVAKEGEHYKMLLALDWGLKGNGQSIKISSLSFENLTTSLQSIEIGACIRIGDLGQPNILVPY